MADENQPLVDDDPISVSTATTLDDDDNYQSILQAISSRAKERVWVVAGYTFIAGLAAIVIGMMLGYSSTIGLELNDIYQKDPNHGIQDQSTQASLFGGFGALGALLGGPIAWPLSDRLGRKPALMLGGIPALIGWLMIAYAHFAETQFLFLVVIQLGRIFTGIGAGWFIFCVFVYVAETSSARLRGLFSACNQLFIDIGILMSYGLGTFAVAYDDFQYYHVALIAAGFVAVFELLMLFFTMETPRWLIAHGKNIEATKVLTILRGPRANITREFQGIQRSIKNTEGLSLTELAQSIRQRSVYIPFILVLMLMFYQQFGGINAAIFYSGSILFQAGARPAKSATIIATITVAVILTIGTFISVLLIDLLGRKVLLVVASTGMCISSLLLGAHFYILNDVCHGCFGTNCTGTHDHVYANDSAPCNSTNIAWLAIVSVALFIATFSLAWGAIPWLSMSELMPLRVRGVTNGIATLVNWAFTAVVTFSFHIYADAVTPKIAWWSFAFVIFTSIFFVLLFLPESKGHSLEEIEEHFEQGHIFACACRGTSGSMEGSNTVQQTLPVST